MKRLCVALILWLLFIPMLAGFAAAQEVIHEFDSDILVNPDASLLVTETIRVTALGKNIKRGIYRDFPTTYKNRLGETVRVGFEVLSVERNGHPEPWHMANRSNGKRVYIGKKETLLPHGEHTFTLVYSTTRQIGYFDEYDELYWNVTGNGWVFPMEKVHARVHLPPVAHVVQLDAYTGKQGAKGKDFTVAEHPDGAEFETTRTLGAREGLTVAVAWPKGLVTEPTGSEKVQLYLQDNSLTPGILLMALALLAYYIVVWSAVGRDQPAGTIIPLFHPPKGFSPAATQFVMNMGFGLSRGANNAFAAALMNMAVKGYLKITDEDDTFVVEKVGQDQSMLSKGEKGIARHLFTGGSRIELKQKNYRTIGKAYDEFKSRVRKEFEGIYFRTNRSFFYVGIALTVLFLFVLIWNAVEPIAAGFMCFWLSGWTLGVLALLRNVWHFFKSGRIGVGIFLSMFSIPFIAGEVFGLSLFVQSTSLAAAVLLALVMLMDFLFYELLKAPTARGRDVMDKIEGFKMFLSVAEQDRFEKLHPPDITPELFEQYLPYALALGVENQWSEKFARALGDSRLVQNYQPSWYHGSSYHHLGAADFAGAVGAGLATAISSSSTAPGSGSGSGGGGSSGGGGGGGGGGGW